MAEMAGPAGTALSVLGAIGQGNAAMAQGEAANRLAKYQAAQLKQNAGQVRAVGQREGEAALRESLLLQSRAQAVAAASGGGALDPTVLKLIGGVAAEGQTAADTERYNAETQAQGLLAEANATRYSGKIAMMNAKQARNAAYMKAVTSVLSGASGFTGAFSSGGGAAAGSIRTTAPSSGGLSVRY